MIAFFLPNISPKGQFKWFLDVLSYLQFVTDDRIDVENSHRSDIHKLRVHRKAEQSAVMALFSEICPTSVCRPKRIT